MTKGTGINLEFAKLCHERYCQVIIGDVRLTPEAEEWIATTKESTSKDQLQDLINAAEKSFGNVPDLGGLEWFNFWEDPGTDGYKSVDINVAHAIKFTRTSIRALLGKNRKGVILAVGSIARQTPDFTRPLCVATKHAISGFVRSLAFLDEYPGITVVCSAPAIVLTRLRTDCPEMKNYSVIEHIALGPKDIAESMIALAGSGMEVPAYNAPPPVGIAADQRILDILEKERGVALKS
ncbi:15-hydroxyprostaglandin dehydrogenase [Cenococcum geophilum]